MPKTLTGEELQLDDAPARDSELFLVDGNNLAYRAFFALPEELQTTDGQPTNALLGFTNMLFKLLSDYTPRGVAVAWDTRPVHRTEISAEYKSERRPMPDLLREQFPHFRPIVEAFGYRNLEFEGWEADDVIATLATRADEAGHQDVRRLHRPRRVPARLRERVPDDDAARRRRRPRLHARAGRAALRRPARPGAGLHRAQGRHERQHPGRSRASGTRPPDSSSRSTARSRSVLEHAGELSPARSRSIIEHAEQARASKLLATMRRDLELDIDLDDVVSRPPDRSQLKEIFRRFEFRALLGRIDTLDDALPAAERPKAESQSVAWREGELPKLARRSVGLAADADRVAVATGGEVVVAAAPKLQVCYKATGSRSPCTTRRRCASTPPTTR